MYIRRKVFSLLQDENGEERYFSTTEFTDERLYAEKEEKEEKPASVGKRVAKDVGIGVGAGLATIGGYQGIKAIKLKKNGSYEMNKADQFGYNKIDKPIKKAVKKVKKSVEKAVKKVAKK